MSGRADDLDPGVTARLLAHLEGTLDEASEAALAHDLATSPLLRTRLAWLEDFIAQTRTTALEPVAESVAEALGEEFRRVRGVHRSRVLHDSRADAVGVRSVGIADRWSVIHTSDVADIAVDYARSGDRVELSGQVLPLDPSAVRSVELLDEHGDSRVVEPDAYGQFTCGTLDPGAYRLLIVLDGPTITVDLVVEL